MPNEQATPSDSVPAANHDAAITILEYQLELTHHLLHSTKDPFLLSAPGQSIVKVMQDILAALLQSANLHFAPTDEGAIHFDPIPNPDRFLIGSAAGLKVAIDLGPKGMGIGPGH
jgi:hypothetical protein